MKDFIDERNFREKCAKSIVKGYNARFVPAGAPQEPEDEKETGAAEPAPWADEISKSEKKWAEQPSFEYGKRKDNDPVTEEQIRKILGEQKVDVMKSFENA